VELVEIITKDKVDKEVKVKGVEVKDKEAEVDQTVDQEEVDQVHLDQEVMLQDLEGIKDQQAQEEHLTGVQEDLPHHQGEVLHLEDQEVDMQEVQLALEAHLEEVPHQEVQEVHLLDTLVAVHLEVLEEVPEAAHQGVPEGALLVGLGVPQALVVVEVVQALNLDILHLLAPVQVDHLEEALKEIIMTDKDLSVVPTVLVIMIVVLLLLILDMEPLAVEEKDFQEQEAFLLLDSIPGMPVNLTYQK